MCMEIWAFLSKNCVACSSGHSTKGDKNQYKQELIRLLMIPTELSMTKLAYSNNLLAEMEWLNSNVIDCTRWVGRNMLSFWCESYKNEFCCYKFKIPEMSHNELCEKGPASIIIIWRAIRSVPLAKENNAKWEQRKHTTAASPTTNHVIAHNSI